MANTLSFSIEEYAKAAGAVLIRNLKGQFLAFVVSKLPAVFAGPLYPLVAFAFGWIFDWVGKQAAFLAFCKYTDFRVAHQGNDLGKAIMAEIQAKKGGDANEIAKAEAEADKAFDNFVVIGR